MPAAFFVFLLILQALLVAVHLAVAETLVAAFGGGTWLPGLFLVISFTFTSAALIARWRKGAFVQWYYRAAAYGVGLVFFLFGGAVTFLLAAAALYRAGFYAPPALLGGLCFSLFFFLHLYGTWTSARPLVTKIKVALPNLPSGWRGKKIVFLSDLHLGNVWRARFAAKIARLVGAIRPEAILIGGDLYDGGMQGDAELIAPLQSAVREAPRGAYFVSGNHEYFLADPPAAMAVIRELGVHVLNNETADLGGLRVIGVDYQSARHRDAFQKIIAHALHEVPGNSPVILLKHEPADLDVARDAGVAFGLFGHTHRGQVFPLSLITHRVYKGFDYGLKSLGMMKVYTSSGAGTWGPPLRLGTRSEVVEITLEQGGGL